MQGTKGVLQTITELIKMSENTKMSITEMVSSMTLNKLAIINISSLSSENKEQIEDIRGKFSELIENIKYIKAVGRGNKNYMENLNKRIKKIGESNIKSELIPGEFQKIL